MKTITADMLRTFHRPQPELFRAFDHLIAARRGMTLMVPVSACEGRLLPLIDQCPVPLREATAILEARHDIAQALRLPTLIAHARSIACWTSARPTQGSMLAEFARELLEVFAGHDGLFLYDGDWRHAQIHTSAGVEPCRVFIGAAGVRLAFVPDFLEGVL